MFKKYTEKLWTFANSVEPFPCKDIEITLSELAEEKKHNKDLTEKLENKVDELSAAKLNISQLETEFEKKEKKFEETLKQKEENLNQTNTDLKTERAKTKNLTEQVTNLKEMNKNRTSELANSIKKLNEIKNKSSEAETIKMLEEVIQGLNGNVENVTKVIWVVEFSSWGYKIREIFH